MEHVQEQVEIDSFSVEARLDVLCKKMEQLSSSTAKTDLHLEYLLVEDFFRDRFRRSTSRRKKTEGRKIGGGQTFIN